VRGGSISLKATTHYHLAADTGVPEVGTNTNRSAARVMETSYRRQGRIRFAAELSYLLARSKPARLLDTVGLCRITNADYIELPHSARRIHFNLVPGSVHLHLFGVREQSLRGIFAPLAGLWVRIRASRVSHEEVEWTLHRGIISDRARECKGPWSETVSRLWCR